MKAVILAGGDGKRLRPITCTMPKPMVPVLGRPTIFYTLELLKKHGVTEAVIALGYMGECIRRAVGSGEAWGMRVTYSDPEKRLGTAGSVRHAVGDTKEETIVLSGDGITDADLSAAAEAHRSSGAAATVVLYKVPEPSEYGVAITDRDGSITRFIEKPSESETFSDLANTGIYILSPEALSLIPSDSEYDFSKDLFPKMLAEGRKLFGFGMQGYWCDVGDVFELRKAQTDMLEGRCAFSSTAKHERGSLIESSAVISPEAVIIGPCYIGSGAEIGSRARIEPYSVICSGVRIMEGSSIKRSVVMDNAIVRRHSELRGAVVCENAEVDSRCLLLEGSVIGAGSRLGKHVTVSPGVLIWPDKTIEEGTECTANVIWGENRRAKHEGSSFSGYADRELTPELAIRISAAFAEEFKQPSDIGAGSDGGAASVMIKQAVISGLLSQGADIVSSDAVSRSAFGHMIRNAGLRGGIYVECDAFERRVSLRIYDESGAEAEEDLLRAIEKRMRAGEVKPTTSSEIGVIRSTGSVGIEYEASIMRLIDMKALGDSPRKLIINAHSMITGAAARILLRAGWTVDTVSELRRLIPTHNFDAVSILCDRDERMAMYVPGFGPVDMNRLLAVIALSTGEKRAVLPAGLDDELRRRIEEAGIEVVPAPEDCSRRRSAARKAGAYDPRLLEPEAITAAACELFSKGELIRLLRSLPEFTRREQDVPVSKCDFGSMLRSVIETDFERVADMTDGVKLRYDSGWVTVRPIAGKNALRVAAGSRDAEYSKELCDLYAEKLRKLKLGDNKA